MLIPGPSSLVLEADASNVAMVSALRSSNSHKMCCNLFCGRAKIASVRLVFHVTHDRQVTRPTHFSFSSSPSSRGPPLCAAALSIQPSPKFLLVSRTLRSLRVRYLTSSRRLAPITRSPRAETQNITRIRLLLERTASHSAREK